jgi:hypothetical protein
MNKLDTRQILSSIKIILSTLFLSSLMATSASAQKYKSFKGQLTYSVQITDTAMRKMYPDQVMRVYTNDTIVRVETDSPMFGEQVTLRHLTLNKSYLLLQVKGVKYAIQTENSSAPDTIVKEIPTYEYKCRGKRKLNTYKVKKVIVTKGNPEVSHRAYYLPAIRPNLLTVYEGIKGLPAVYFIALNEGELKYELQSIEEKPLSRDLFGIPNDYKQISFDDFLKEIIPTEN